MTVEQINRMLGFALNSKKLKDKLMDTSQLINEINIEYARTMNKIVFDDMLVGLYKSNPDNPQIESAWFLPLNLSSENLGSSLRFQMQLVPLRVGVAHRRGRVGGGGGRRRWFVFGD